MEDVVGAKHQRSGDLPRRSGPEGETLGYQEISVEDCRLRVSTSDTERANRRAGRSSCVFGTRLVTRSGKENPHAENYNEHDDDQ